MRWCFKNVEEYAFRNIPAVPSEGTLGEDAPIAVENRRKYSHLLKLVKRSLDV